MARSTSMNGAAASTIRATSLRCVPSVAGGAEWDMALSPFWARDKPVRPAAIPIDGSNVPAGRRVSQRMRRSLRFEWRLYPQSAEAREAPGTPAELSWLAAGFASGLPLVSGTRLEDEHLRGDVRLDVVLAHEGEHLATAQLLDGPDGVVPDDLLDRTSCLEDLVRTTIGRQRALRFGQAVLHDDGDRVVAHLGARPLRPAPGGPMHQRDHGVGDGQRLRAMPPA